jgi:hypothetical protein
MVPFTLNPVLQALPESVVISNPIRVVTSDGNPASVSCSSNARLYYNDSILPSLTYPIPNGRLVALIVTAPAELERTILANLTIDDQIDTFCVATGNQQVEFNGEDLVGGTPPIDPRSAVRVKDQPPVVAIGNGLLTTHTAAGDVVESAHVAALAFSDFEFIAGVVPGETDYILIDIGTPSDYTYTPNNTPKSDSLYTYDFGAAGYSQTDSCSIENAEVIDQLLDPLFVPTQESLEFLVTDLGSNVLLNDGDIVGGFDGELPLVIHQASSDTCAYDISLDILDSDGQPMFASTDNYRLVAFFIYDGGLGSNPPLIISGGEHDGEPLFYSDGVRPILTDASPVRDFSLMLDGGSNDGLSLLYSDGIQPILIDNEPISGSIEDLTTKVLAYDSTHSGEYVKDYQGYDILVMLGNPWLDRLSNRIIKGIWPILVPDFHRQCLHLIDPDLGRVVQTLYNIGNVYRAEYLYDTQSLATRTPPYIVTTDFSGHLNCLRPTPSHSLQIAGTILFTVHCYSICASAPLAYGTLDFCLVGTTLYCTSFIASRLSKLHYDLSDPSILLLDAEIDFGSDSNAHSVTYVASTQELWVTDYSRKMVIIVDEPTFAVKQELIIGASYPAGIAYASATDQVWIASAGSSKILILAAATRQVVRTIASTDTSIKMPVDLAYDAPQNRIWVTDYINQKVYSYDADIASGTSLMSFDCNLTPIGFARELETNRVYSYSLYEDLYHDVILDKLHAITLNPPAYTDLEELSPDVYVESNAITVSGFDGQIYVNLQPDALAFLIINGVVTAELQVLIMSGDRVAVTAKTSAAYNTPITIHLTIAHYLLHFKITTVLSDAVLMPLVFIPVYDADIPNVIYTSNEQVIRGNLSAGTQFPIYLSAGILLINGVEMNAYIEEESLTEPMPLGMVTYGDRISLRMTTRSMMMRTRLYSVTVGDLPDSVTGDWTVRTVLFPAIKQTTLDAIHVFDDFDAAHTVVDIQVPVLLSSTQIALGMGDTYGLQATSYNLIVLDGATTYKQTSWAMTIQDFGQPSDINRTFKSIVIDGCTVDHRSSHLQLDVACNGHVVLNPQAFISDVAKFGDVSRRTTAQITDIAKRGCWQAFSNSQHALTHVTAPWVSLATTIATDKARTDSFIRGNWHIEWLPRLTGAWASINRKAVAVKDHVTGAYSTLTYRIYLHHYTPSYERVISNHLSVDLSGYPVKDPASLWAVPLWTGVLPLRPRGAQIVDGAKSALTLWKNLVIDDTLRKFETVNANIHVSDPDYQAIANGLRLLAPVLTDTVAIAFGELVIALYERFPLKNLSFDTVTSDTLSPLNHTVIKHQIQAMAGNKFNESGMAAMALAQIMDAMAYQMPFVTATALSPSRSEVLGWVLAQAIDTTMKLGTESIHLTDSSPGVYNEAEGTALAERSAITKRLIEKHFVHLLEWLHNHPFIRVTTPSFPPTAFIKSYGVDHLTPIDSMPGSKPTYHVDPTKSVPNPKLTEHVQPIASVPNPKLTEHVDPTKSVPNPKLTEHVQPIASVPNPKLVEHVRPVAVAFEIARALRFVDIKRLNAFKFIGLVTAVDSRSVRHIVERRPAIKSVAGNHRQPWLQVSTITGKPIFTFIKSGYGTNLTPYNCEGARYFISIEEALVDAESFGHDRANIYTISIGDSCYVWGVTRPKSTPCSDEDLLRGYVHGG